MKSSDSTYNYRINWGLVNLYTDRNEIKRREESYVKSLKLYQILAQNNSSKYVPYVSDILYNLTILYRANNELEKSEETYRESLELYRVLVL